ncbi:MAG: DUF2178 domain-containing protein [Candidatus Methanoperedens sp.]|nr:DUF2178 domain-containing protein [Candidatus Methanoperedens sp.]
MKFKIEFRPDILKFIGISFIGILIGLFLFFLIEPLGVLGFILILGGFMGLLIALFAASKPGCDLVRDERLIKNAEKAGYHSFLILMFIAAIIVFLRMLKLSPSLTPSYELFDAANSLYLIGLLSYIILYRYYKWKGE